jgi:hypothetical protein
MGVSKGDLDLQKTGATGAMMVQIGGFVLTAQGGGSRRPKACGGFKKIKIPREQPGEEDCLRRPRRKQISLPLLSAP